MMSEQESSASLGFLGEVAVVRQSVLGCSHTLVGEMKAVLAWFVRKTLL